MVASETPFRFSSIFKKLENQRKPGATALYSSEHPYRVLIRRDSRELTCLVRMQAQGRHRTVRKNSLRRRVCRALHCRASELWEVCELPRPWCLVTPARADWDGRRSFWWDLSRTPHLPARHEPPGWAGGDMALWVLSDTSPGCAQTGVEGHSHFSKVFTSVPIVDS